MVSRHNLWIPAIALAVAAAGCSGEGTPGGETIPMTGTAGAVGATTAPTVGTPGPVTNPAVNGAGPAAPIATATSTAPSAPGASLDGVAAPAPGVGAVAPAADGMPCDIAKTLETNCALCHGAEPKFGAPMALTTIADFMAPSISDPTKTIADMVKVRVNATDNTRMPPVSSAAIPEAELAGFNAWLDGGLAAGNACAPTAAGPTDVVVTNPSEADPSLTCYKFLAHADGSMDQKFQVGAARDAYFNFFFNAPWTGTKYAKSMRVILDNEQVVHHWLLYQDPGKHANAGSVAPSIGAHTTGMLMHGWAPGGEDLEMTPEAALELPETGFTLEFHYNSSDPSASDASGVEVCVTDTPPENLATLSWLGTISLSGPSATGECAPAATEPIRILGGTPHMHVKGKHMKVVINRKDGSKEVIHDEAFDFEYQRAYDYSDQEIWLQPGETISTTCDYTGPVSFGEGTGDEMCYFFTLAYPAYKLSMPGPGALINGPGACFFF